MQQLARRGPLWIVATLGVVALISAVIWLNSERGTQQERLVAEMTRELARMNTVQGRLNITLQGVILEQV